MPFLRSLNPLQLEAATHAEGPLLVLAGAGSGKTRVLTSRIANLVKNGGVDPSGILAVTFTNKAAREIKERLKKLIGESAGELWTGTFHTIGLNILRAENERAGNRKALTVYDEEQQGLLVKLVMSELGIDDRKTPWKMVQFEINMARNSSLSPDGYLETSTSMIADEVHAVFREYEKKLVEMNAVDFGDLICRPISLLKRDPEARERYSTRFRHILVDEYQDTNSSQYVLTRLLASNHRNLCVVGDPDQSIYGWRGADVANILNFREDYPDATFVKLEQNYRSTKNILASANSVICNNTERLEKTLWTKNPDGDLPVYEECLNGHSEAAFVVRKIKTLMDENPGMKFKDFAILYRTNTQSRAFEEVLFEEGVPYNIIGGFRFYDRREIKDALAYLKSLVNPDDSLNFLRIINVPPRGIGKATLSKVHSVTRSRGAFLYEACREVASESVALKEFVGTFDNMREEAGRRGVAEMVSRVLDFTGYIDFWESKKNEDGYERAKNLHGLVESVETYERNHPGSTLADYLSLVSLMSDSDGYEEKTNRITLMTIHSAKGLEFPTVFMVGMEDGLFPHERSVYEEDSLEEERRLCYVGMTRARKRLYLTSASNRSAGKETRTRGPSRFLGEIDPEYLSTKTPTSAPDNAKDCIEMIRKMLT